MAVPSDNNEEQKNSSPKEDRVQRRFLLDALNLFGRERSGHMGRYAYTPPHYTGDPAGGEAFWEKFIQSAEYYLFGEESRLIQESADEIVDCLPDYISVVELGPGESQAVKNKTIPLMRAFNKASGAWNMKKNIREYIALDISKDYLDSARRMIEKEFYIPTEGVHSDFTEAWLKIRTKATPVMFLFGGTLFNASSIKGFRTEYVLRSYLDNIRDIIGEGGYLIMTQDTNRNGRKLKRAYNQEMCKAMALAIMHRIERDLDTKDFSGNDFEYRVNWNKFQGVLSLNAVSTVKTDKTFYIGGMPFRIRKGEEFSLVNAFKYSAEKFKRIAEEAGFKVVKTIEQDPGKGSIALHVLKIGPKLH